MKSKRLPMLDKTVELSGKTGELKLNKITWKQSGSYFYPCIGKMELPDDFAIMHQYGEKPEKIYLYKTSYYKTLSKAKARSVSDFRRLIARAVAV
jgi:hypothetical protein